MTERVLNNLAWVAVAICVAPIVAAADILEQASVGGNRRREQRDSGLEETRDDLQAILAELEEIYDD